jgi:hypothetical protein
MIVVKGVLTRVPRVGGVVKGVLTRVPRVGGVVKGVLTRVPRVGGVVKGVLIRVPRVSLLGKEPRARRRGAGSARATCIRRLRGANGSWGTPGTRYSGYSCTHGSLRSVRDALQ